MRLENAAVRKVRFYRKKSPFSWAFAGFILYDQIEI